MNVSRICSSGFAVALATALLSFVGCGDSTSPGVEPEIINNPDSFEFQITDVRDLSRNMLYTWENTGLEANVDQSSTLTSGSVTLQIRDDNDVLVYTRDLADNGSFATQSGAAGTWTILVVFADASGTLNFRVQKRP